MPSEPLQEGRPRASTLQVETCLQRGLLHFLQAPEAFHRMLDALQPEIMTLGGPKMFRRAGTRPVWPVIFEDGP